MMALLLPQAVPLLRTVSTDKEFTVRPSDMLPCQVNSKDEQKGYSVDVLPSGKYTLSMLFFLAFIITVCLA